MMVELLDRIRLDPACEVRPPAGVPQVRHRDQVPSDVAEFYSLCGGVTLFAGADYTCEFISPSELRRANPMIMGEEFPDDITDSWYVIVHDFNGDYLSIDFAPERCGRCYDSFHERHGLAGDCPIIAKSLTNLLEQLFDNRGGYWYWLESGFASLGDAYD